jgi:hypothetical protein
VGEWAEAEARASAVIARNTGSTPFVSRSGGPIAAAVSDRPGPWARPSPPDRQTRESGFGVLKIARGGFGTVPNATIRRFAGLGEPAARPGSRPDLRAICTAQRNGGRHCCQPPLRRAKDLPVFVTWSPENPKAPMNPLSILAHQLRRRFPPCISLFRGARLTYSTTWPESSLVVRSARPGRNRNSSQNRPMFRGPSWETLYRVPLCSPKFRRTPGAASHDRKISLPAPLTSWLQLEPEGSHHCLPAEIGPLVTCRTRLPLPALGEAGTAVPIT